ncbi:hypothetical protein BpHYR1_039921 [Brachionus plicatilis]|uniref:Uncharacterized protein n=1 Tax=Brachionus plicatilis TaxID=10195 RepID=A0A3M7QBC6_BRAPC|nr:hypothetical protein BpHYR1_039921 [Brachionus plicatilis]
MEGIEEIGQHDFTDVDRDLVLKIIREFLEQDKVEAQEELRIIHKNFPRLLAHLELEEDFALADVNFVGFQIELEGRGQALFRTDRGQPTRNEKPDRSAGGVQRQSALFSGAQESQGSYKCRNCNGSPHAFSVCPAQGKLCANCGIENDFAAAYSAGRQGKPKAGQGGASRSGTGYGSSGSNTRQGDSRYGRGQGQRDRVNRQIDGDVQHPSAHSAGYASLDARVSAQAPQSQSEYEEFAEFLRSSRGRSSRCQNRVRHRHGHRDPHDQPVRLRVAGTSDTLDTVHDAVLWVHSALLGSDSLNRVGQTVVII